MFDLPKIITATQTRAADQHTISTEPITSIDLMERASITFTEALLPYLSPGDHIAIICGPGNNGGDGLAIARLLAAHPYNIEVFVDQDINTPSSDYQYNLKKLSPSPSDIEDLSIDILQGFHVVIDALFGTGINKPITGKWKTVVDLINQSPTKVYSVDIPSGMIPEQLTLPETVVQSHHTFTFQRPKRSFLFPESQACLQQFTVLNIGLDENFINAQDGQWYWLTEKIRTVLPTRLRFSHKGNYGHALIVAGSQLTMGAAVLSTRSALKSGVGLVSIKCPSNLQLAINITCPEAMLHADGNYQKYTSIGIGPGLGKDSVALQKLKRALTHTQKIVIDADAINLLSEHRELLELLPQHTILTPHPKELERLIGKWKDSAECLEKQLLWCKTHRAIMVAKNAHTVITTPEGEVYINTNGNPGMAKGGSGDVLTGLITGLLAQNIHPVAAACLGVFTHAQAGDKAQKELGANAMNSGDLIKYIS